MKIFVTRAGFLTSVQDLGRVGFRQFGVSTSGALDPFALRVANLVAGSDESAAGLEITFGGLHLRFMDDRVVAWCGGKLGARVGSISLPAGHAGFVHAGEELRFEHAHAGCRCWLAISGGIDVPIVLGSRSTDLRANFGGFEGRALRDGDVVPLGRKLRSEIAAIESERISSWSAPKPWSQTVSGAPMLRFVRGAGWNLFDDLLVQRFTSGPFTVSPDSDRMGVRFDGPELKWRHTIHLISEAVAPGAVQVPPNGKPILLLGDCQTIGGYPKIAHVISVDLGMAAQLRAGDVVRFAEVSLADAYRLLLERESELKRFRIGLSLHDL
jgi:antagonist of KipI